MPDLNYDPYMETSEEGLWEQFSTTIGLERADICIALGSRAYNKGNQEFSPSSLLIKVEKEVAHPLPHRTSHKRLP